MGRVRDGDELGTTVEDVGTGVGYSFESGIESRGRFNGRGKVGEEESGSKAGRREAAGRLTPAAGGRETSFLLGEESMPHP